MRVRILAWVAMLALPSVARGQRSSVPRDTVGCRAAARAAVQLWLHAIETGDSAAVVRAVSPRFGVISAGRNGWPEPFFRAEKISELVVYARRRAAKHERFSNITVPTDAWRNGRLWLGVVSYTRRADDIEGTESWLGKGEYECGRGISILNTAPQGKAPLRGITFTVDTSTNGDIMSGALGALRLRVTFAEGRGRMDVLTRVARPAVQGKWVTFAPTSAIPGDYYLFDSSAFTHVRPASRTYTTYSLADASFNYQGQRDRWPFFRQDSEMQATLYSGKRITQGSRGNFNVFWHSELAADTSCTGMSFGSCLVRELARGRVDVIDTPAEEFGIIRWFGATRALAAIPGLDSLTDAHIRLTAVGYWKATDNRVAQTATVRFALGLNRIKADPSRFIIPKGYRKTAPRHSGTS